MQFFISKKPHTITKNAKVRGGFGEGWEGYEGSGAGLFLCIPCFLWFKNLLTRTTENTEYTEIDSRGNLAHEREIGVAAGVPHARIGDN